jgi:carotenoid cleavage dioxygenase-like enzyme
MSKAFAVGLQNSRGTTDPVELQVEGRLPEWLAGAFLRNGPALFTIDGTQYNHWFDGLAMLHRFGFQDGRIDYRSRWLDSRNRREVVASGQPRFDQFATNPKRSFWQKLVDTFDFTLQFGDNDLVSFGRFDDTWVALGETPIPLVIDPGTLETQGPFRFRDRLIGMIACAHPARDEQRRTTYGYDTFVFPLLARYSFWQLDDGSSTRRRLWSQRIGRPSYMHSFGMSADHLVVTEFPLRLRPGAMVLGCWTGVPFIENFDWTGEDVVFTVIEKDTGRVTGTFHAPAFFAFHHVNAWEDGEGRIVLDIAAYEDSSVIAQTYFARLLADDGGDLPVSRLLRYRVPIEGSGALMPPEVLSGTAFEMPAIHPARVGLPYRYTFGYGFDDPGNLNDTLYKIDLHAPEGRRLTRWSQPDCYPSEPVFVPRPGSDDEDDGVLLSVVLDGAHASSFLVVLDARDMRELARAAVPIPIPLGLHGAYVGSTP